VTHGPTPRNASCEPWAGPGRGRPNSLGTRGHLKELLGKHRHSWGSISVRLSQNTSHKSEVLRPSFATRKVLRIQGMRPSRGTLDFGDTRLLSAL
jgi:hypothetical protein